MQTRSIYYGMLAALICFSTVSCKKDNTPTNGNNNNNNNNNNSPTGYNVTTIAGSDDNMGFADGTGATAQFNGPEGIVMDGSGNMIIADNYNHCIRKMTPAGVVTTIAGTPGVSGYADGVAATAKFDDPSDVAVDAAGNIYVSDFNNYCVRKIANGTVSTIAGNYSTSGHTDGTGTSALFFMVTAICVDASGNVYVADGGSGKELIRKITAAGVVTTLAGGTTGYADGAGTAAQFGGIYYGMAVNSNNEIIVSDHGVSLTTPPSIRKITAGGTVSTIYKSASNGHADGSLSTATSNALDGITLDNAGNIYMVDMPVIRKLSTDGNITTIAGSYTNIIHTDGTGASAGFFNPEDLAIDGNGNIYVTENSTIRKISK